MIGLSGAILVLGILAVDWLGAGREMGIGPTQRIALAAAAGLFILGITLVPFGNRPA